MDLSLPLNSSESEARNFIWAPWPLLELRSVLSLIRTKQTIFGSTFSFQKWIHCSWPEAFLQKQTAISAGHQKQPDHLQQHHLVFLCDFIVMVSAAV